MLSVDQINKLEAENQKLKSDLQAAVTQYNAVVNQNKDLQTELNEYKKAQEKKEVEQNKKIDLILTKCAYAMRYKYIAQMKQTTYDIQEIAKELRA